MSAVRPQLLALLADCKEHPSEDRLRLVLADWLEDANHPLDLARSELVRAQIELAHLSEHDPRRSEFGRLARVSQQRHLRDWLGPLQQWASDAAHQRGLLALTVATRALRASGLLALASGEPWAWVETLCLRQCHDEDLAPLRANPLLSSINALAFQQSQLGPAGIQALAGRAWLAGLHRLDLTQQPIGTPGLTALLHSPYLHQLTQLDLSGTDLDGAAGTRLSASPHRLQRLILWGNRLGDTGARALVADNGLLHTTWLDLRSNNIGDDGACALASSPVLSHLHFLQLADNRIGAEGARALADSTVLRHLNCLMLWGNPITESGIRLLQDRFGSRVHLASLNV